jgi:hypothetical protein
MMAWHIFRKDWRLLWPLATGVALLQVLIVAIIWHSEPFPLLTWQSNTADLLTFGLAVAMTLLIVLTIQQESIPSTSQDWLTRPVKRGDLLSGKLLTIALVVHGPILLVNILQGLGEGFALGPVLRATLDSNCEILLCYTLPFMFIAATTRNVVESIVFGLAVLVVYLSAGVATPATTGTGLIWIGRSLAHAELLLVTIAALCWQYSRRSRHGTHQAQALFLVGVLLSAWTPLLPWDAAFTIQRWFAANPHASQSISIAVEHERFPPERQVLWEDEPQGPPSKGFERVSLPVRFSGLPGGVIVHVDRVRFRLRRDDGTLLYSSFGSPFEFPADDAGMVQESLLVPEDLYARNHSQPLRLELEYFATLIRGRTVSPSVPLGGARRLPGFGWCAARADHDVEVGCRQMGALPFCISLTLGHSAEKFVCEPNYEPVPLRFSVDPIDHVQAKLPRPAAGDPATVVTIRVYEPEDHFSRQVQMMNFRLQDWRP